MATDWIAACKTLSRKLEVLAIAQATRMRRREVVGTLLDFWAWADDETDDGTLPGLTIDSLASANTTPESFFVAMIQVGWLRQANGLISIPNFKRWMGKSAKGRLAKNTRQARWRSPGETNRDVDDRVGAFVDDDVGASVGASVGAYVGADASLQAPTREPNRTEPSFSNEKEPPTPFEKIPAVLDTSDFRAVWDEWKKHRAEIRKPLKPTTAKKQLETLASWGPTKGAESLQMAIRNGWTGFFEPGERKNGNHSDGPRQHHRGTTSDAKLDAINAKTKRVGGSADADNADVPALLAGASAAGERG